MIIDLTSTTTAAIADAIRRAHASSGHTAMGFTLVAVTDTAHLDEVSTACRRAGAEHPSRVLLVVADPAGDDGLDAVVQSGEGVPGDIVTLQLGGEVAEHAAQVVTPLLLPDVPVVAWWPHDAPDDLAADPVGALAQRRIADATTADDPVAALRRRGAHVAAGDTDLAWTRLTPWRALLAAGLDQHPARVTAGRVEAEPGSAPAALVAAWLRNRLDVEVELTRGEGPGITAIALVTAAGEVAVRRPDADVARFEVPGQPSREVALRRRDTNELITEELRRMDADEIYEAAVRSLAGAGRGRR